MKIIFVGLSNKINTKPLDSNTISGALIDEIINGLNFECIKTNLVNFAPLNENGKLRYPNQHEKDCGYIDLKKILQTNNPSLVVCLGDIVYRYLENKLENVVKIKHPAYIAVYRRAEKEHYIASSIDLIHDYQK